MTQSPKCPAVTLFPEERRHGFIVRRVEQISEIRVTAYEMEHERSGARVLHLHCDDRENLYAIAFRTPPPDSTGLPHILEHSVLAGSERYPLKDVFNELLKGTLQTFINAFTYPDKTIYPVASQVRADYYNLARVYTDLVLRPRLLPQTFAQEGHHFELADPEDPGSDLIVSGIVFNEMKGAYSSPESLMFKALQENLYPDTPYTCDSGGSPEAIPSLTYDQFKAFHRTYYSPSNAYWFLYGDISTTDHMIFLEEMLAGFDRVRVDSGIASQPRWNAPSAVRGDYPVGKEESLQRKTTVNVGWMMSENTDHDTTLLLQITAGALVGSAAGPLRKALIDSGLGEDLSPITGLERDLKQIAFVVGLRGTEPERAQPIETLTIDTLRRVAEDGFDRELIEGTLHQVEFHGKEIQRGAFPYGITLMERVFHTWLYDGDPLAGLNFPRLIEAVRMRWAEKPALFEDVVRKWFLDNPHRLLSVMEPSPDYLDKQESSFKNRMSGIKASLPAGAVEKIRRDAEALKSFQAQADGPETLACLPRLNVLDLERTVEKIPTERLNIGGVPALAHEFFTNGIAYLDLAFDISDIPEELQPCLPLLGKFMTNMGAAGLDYGQMAKRIALKTGGFGSNLSAGLFADRENGSGGKVTTTRLLSPASVQEGRERFSKEKHWQKMIFSVRALHRHTGEAVDILADVLTAGDLSDETRMRDLLAEKKNGLHAAVIPSGHLFAKRSAGASLSVAAWRDEQWSGKTQLLLLAELMEAFGERKEAFRDKLIRLKDLIFRRERLTLNLTADAEGLGLLGQAAEGLLERLPGGGHVGQASVPDLQSRDAGVAIPAQVCYVAQAMKAPTYTDPLAAPLWVLSRQLSSGYLYKHIRVQGGAYGGMCQYDPMNGLFAFLSYRDPHLLSTLDVFRRAVDFMTKEKISAEDLEKAVVGAIGSLDRPMDPAGKGFTAMIREFAGLTDDDRQVFRDGILNVTSDQLQETAVHYFKPAAAAAVVAIYAAEERLIRANETLPARLTIERLP
ncbi:MAG: insulinase family protein [Pseudomonadota bacterium]